MNWVKTALFVVVVAAVSAGGAYWLASRGGESRVTVTVQSIRKVAQLATVEYRLSTLIEKTFRSSWGLGTTDSSRMLAYYTGTVKGSIDLEKIQLQLKGGDAGTAGESGGPRRASIHFPRGSIVIRDVALIPGEDSMREMVTWVRPAFNGPTDGQREGVRQEALKTILQTAIRQGIVEKTKDNARTILSEFLGGFGIVAEVTFDEKAFHADDPALEKLAESAAKR